MVCGRLKRAATMARRRQGGREVAGDDRVFPCPDQMVAVCVAEDGHVPQTATVEHNTLTVTERAFDAAFQPDPWTH